AGRSITFSRARTSRTLWLGPDRRSGLGGLRRLRGCLGGLLGRSHLVEGLLVDDVGDRHPRAVLAIGARCLAPTFGCGAVLLAEQREEDAGLLVPEARQRLETPEHLATVGARPVRHRRL